MTGHCQCDIKALLGGCERTVNVGEGSSASERNVKVCTFLPRLLILYCQLSSSLEMIVVLGY